MPIELTPIPTLQRLAHRLAEHRTAAVSALVLTLAGFAVTAVAIAPLVPDASTLPQRLVTETLIVEGLPAQAEALASHELSLVRNETTRSGDTADVLLARLGVSDAAAARFLRSDRTVRALFTGRTGKRVQAVLDEHGALVELVARFATDNADLARSHFTRLSARAVASPAGTQWQARLETVPFGTQARMASGSIRSSLFAASDDAGVPDGVAIQMAEIFATDIDFHRELRKGDTFNVVWESLTADGEPVSWQDGSGRVLAADFVNAGKTYHAMWFVPPGSSKGAYYGLDGQSRKRSFLASPMEFSRVTSGFANRFHPIFQTWRQHLGVDYAAPQGTPVRAVGDGVVEFSGWQNGYGNVVMVRHGGDRETLYAHLSRIDVRKGQKIEQGEHLGLVGRTGWATGPHLHFEFRVAGQHQDPLLIAKSSETLALDAAGRAGFASALPTVQAQLRLAGSTGAAPGPRARFE